MSYTSYFYLLFFLGVLVALYYLIPLKKRWLVLLGGSYFFYWMASGKMIVFLLITTVSVYLGALAMEREQQAFDSVRKVWKKEEEKPERRYDGMWEPQRLELSGCVFRSLRLFLLSVTSSVPAVRRFFRSSVEEKIRKRLR